MNPNDMQSKAEILGRLEVEPALTLPVKLGESHTAMTTAATLSNGGGLCTLKFPVRVGEHLLLDVKVNVSWAAVNHALRSGEPFTKIPGLRSIKQAEDGLSSEVERLEAYRESLPKNWTGSQGDQDVETGLEPVSAFNPNEG